MGLAALLAAVGCKAKVELPEGIGPSKSPGGPLVLITEQAITLVTALGDEKLASLQPRLPSTDELTTALRAALASPSAPRAVAVEEAMGTKSKRAAPSGSPNRLLKAAMGDVMDSSVGLKAIFAPASRAIDVAADRRAPAPALVAVADAARNLDYSHLRLLVGATDLGTGYLFVVRPNADEAEQVERPEPAIDLELRLDADIEAIAYARWSSETPFPSGVVRAGRQVVRKAGACPLAPAKEGAPDFEALRGAVSDICATTRALGIGLAFAPTSTAEDVVRLMQAALPPEACHPDADGRDALSRQFAFHALPWRNTAADCDGAAIISPTLATDLLPKVDTQPIAIGVGSGGMGFSSGLGTTQASLGRIRVDRVESRAGVDLSKARRSVQLNLRSVNDCYLRLVKKNKSLRGRVTLSLSLAGTRVRKAKLSGLASRNRALSRCMVKRARSWRFPRELADTNLDVHLELIAPAAK